MVNGALHFLAAARDLTFQRSDPRLQLRNGERVEILAHQLVERVAGAWQRVVELHVRQR